MKVTIYSTHGFDRPFLEKATLGKHQLTFVEEALNKKTVNLAKDSDAICIFSGDDANKEVLESLHKIGVKYIALRMTGYDNVDLETCRKLKIKVANVPGYSPFAIAEHAMMMALCLNRKVKLSQKLIKQHDFRLDRLIGFDMKNKTVGIIGTGRIGAVFAKIANGFGCELLAFDVKENAELKKEVKIKYVSLDELCQKSDIISLHCPLNDSTKHLLDKDKFALMKDGVLVINTSRGGVIKTKDLLEALESDKIGAVGLDVYEFEKGLFFDKHQQVNDPLFNKLQDKENVMMTCHQAFLTQEALENIASSTIYNLDCFEAGKNSDNEI